MGKDTRTKKLEAWAWDWMINRGQPWLWHSQLVKEALTRGARQEDIDRLLDKLNKEGKIYYIRAFGSGCIGLRV